MNHEDAVEIFLEEMNHCTDILASKSAEYSRNGDKLHNFKAAAKMLNCQPETALWGMATKHEVSLKDIVDDIELLGKLPELEVLTEKITDAINYKLLLLALIRERMEVVASHARDQAEYGGNGMYDVTRIA